MSPDNGARFGATLLIADVGETVNPPGDYNDDNVVNAADYVVWRKNNNTSTTLPNDTTSGNVDNGDYTVWRANFGQAATTGLGSGSLSNAAISEPTTSVLLVFAAAGWCLRQRRNSHQLINA